MPIYMNISGITGDSTSSQFAGWFEVMSFSWGMSTSVDIGTGGGAGKASIGAFSITKPAGQGSPLIVGACNSGKLLPAVQFAVTKGGGRDKPHVYEKFVLTQVLVSSYQIEDDWAGSPSEAISFNFHKMEFDQNVQAADGSVSIQSILIGLNQS